MPEKRSILLVENDAGFGQALATLLRRWGNHVRVVRTRSQALLATRRRRYDLAVIDLFLFLRGGGAELARELARRVPQVYLTLGAKLATEEIVEAVLGFPVCHKAALPAVIAGHRADSRLDGRRPNARATDWDSVAASR